MGVSKAIADALRNQNQEFARTRRSDAQSSSGASGQLDGVGLGARVLDSRKIKVNVRPCQAFKPNHRTGGKTGWYFGNWLWSVRELIDLLVGRIGIRRGRRDPESLRLGDTVDLWRVVAYEPVRKVLRGGDEGPRTRLARMRRRRSRRRFIGHTDRNFQSSWPTWHGVLVFTVSASHDDLRWHDSWHRQTVSESIRVLPSCLIC